MSSQGGEGKEWLDVLGEKTHVSGSEHPATLGAVFYFDSGKGDGRVREEW